MKIRLTFGNVIAILTTAAGAIAAHEQLITLVTSSIGGKAIAVGGALLAISKGFLSFNSGSIPEHKKATLGPVVLEKTGPFTI